MRLFVIALAAVFFFLKFEEVADSIAADTHRIAVALEAKK